MAADPSAAGLVSHPAPPVARAPARRLAPLGASDPASRPRAPLPARRPSS
jgi:hypothetical protein